MRQKKQKKNQPQSSDEIIKPGKNCPRLTENEKAGERGRRRQCVTKPGYILISVIWTRSANDVHRVIDFFKRKNEGLYHNLKKACLF